MKILKKILLVVLFIIAIPFVVALFLKKDYAVERDVTIAMPKSAVFDYIKYLKNQNIYSKWATMDPAMKKTYSGTDGTIGFVSAWDSDNRDVGAGEQEIKKISDGDRIDFEIRFLKPFKTTEKAFMTTEAISENQTKVNWGFSGHMAYPMNFMLLVMDFEGMFGKDLQTGLNNLKGILEK